MPSMNLDQLFQDFHKLRVLIVGDVMVDNYIIGKVDRVSPEAPVPVVDVTSFDARLGGAGNVALNVLAMGAEPILCSAIGEDKEGTDLIQLLQEKGLTARAILQSPKRKTTTKTRVIGNNHQLLRIDHEIKTPLDQMDSFLLEQHFERELERSHVVIFEDYNKGVLHESLIHSLIARANAAGVPVVVDPKKANFLSYQSVTLFKPNLKELKEGLNLDADLGDMEQLRKAIGMLKEKLNARSVMVTLSERGVYLSSEDGEYHIPAHVRNISDVSGAGDTVISVAALCIAAGCRPELTASLSNLAGGLVCEEAGVVPVNPAQLLSEAKKS